MKQARMMQTIRNGRRMPLDVDVIIFSVEKRKIREGKGRNKRGNTKYNLREIVRLL